MSNGKINKHALNQEPYGRAEKRCYAHVALSADQAEKLEYMMIGTGMNRSKYIRSVLFDNNNCYEKLVKPDKRSYHRGTHRVVVHFLVTTEEKRRLQQECKIRGVNESEFIRFTLFANV